MESSFKLHCCIRRCAVKEQYAVLHYSIHDFVPNPSNLLISEPAF